MRRLRIAKAPSGGLVEASWESHDRYRTWTRLTIVGVPLAVALAFLGLPSIDVHAPLHYLGVMGPTCGITRGVMWFARGDLTRAWLFNPASFLVIPVMVAVLFRALYGRLTGRWLRLVVRRRLLVWAGPAFLIVLLSIRQQGIAEFLLANLAG